MNTLTLLLSLVVLLAGCSKPTATTYWCPMHPEVTSPTPNAQCDKCGGMKLLPKETTAANPKGTKYFCPMHPQITSDKPGDCPICNMRLVVADHADSTVKISPAVRQRIGLKLGHVEPRELTREIRTAARLVPAETRQHRVTARVEGWVEKVHVTTGQSVKAGDPLLTVFSPELLAAQRETEIGGDSAKRRLELLGFDGNTLRAPATGHILERNILPGQKIMSNDPLLLIADLTTLWAEVELFPSDLVPVDTPVELSVADQTITGKVIYVSPALDPATRTAKARIEIPNTELSLKPEMLATASLKLNLGRQLALPAAALMRSGTKTYVFRDEGEGKLIPVEVQIGARAGDWFELRAGLKDGDAIVTSANFLVDSESQLKAALSGISHEH